VCKANFRWSGAVVWCSGFGVVAVVLFLTLFCIAIMWCQIYAF